MRLVDLDPRWCVDATIVLGGVAKIFEGRIGMGLTFACPCCVAKLSPELQAVVAQPGRELPPGVKVEFLGVWFANPIDGLPPTDDATCLWQRTGDAFDTLTLAPSVDASKFSHWHGHIQNGEIR